MTNRYMDAVTTPSLYPVGRQYQAPDAAQTLTTTITGLRHDLDRSVRWGESVVTNETHFPFNGFSSGTATATNYRSSHWTKRGQRVTALKLVFANSILGATGESAGVNVHTVKASIEYNGVTYPVFFGFGNRTKTLAIDEQVVSDPVYVSIPANTQFWVRTFLTVTTLGERWPVGPAAVSATGEGYASTTDKTDLVAYTTFAAASIYTPAAILGLTRDTVYNPLLLGSSSAQGQGDIQEAPYYDNGYLSRSLNNQHGVIKLTRPSTQMSHFLTVSGYARQLEFIYRVKPTHIIQQLGSNDLTSGATVATMKSRLADMWSILGSTGAKVLQCTYTPVTTSTDNWATLAGQTIHASNDERQEINEWLRDGAGGSTAISGIVECCKAVESTRNSGKWKVTGVAGAYTADGTHLTQLGHRETAATIDMTKLLAL